MYDSSARLIARRYAKALFDLSVSAGAVDAVAKDLGAFRAALEASDALRSFVRNPVLSRAESTKAIGALLEKMKVHELTRKFFALLAEHRRLGVIHEICDVFFAMVSEHRGEVVAEAVFAAAPEMSEIAALTAALKKSTGREVNLKTYEDPSLLGGLVLKIGGKMMDRSLKTALGTMETALKRATVNS